VQGVINISKNIDISKPAASDIASSKEDEKKK